MNTEYKKIEDITYESLEKLEALGKTVKYIELSVENTSLYS